ncbi:MAG: hypothetical protein E7680_04490 [Ruminococcaceae bacterium]|nr:hypothetical protein [Oscillospiraceae bacterium]
MKRVLVLFLALVMILGILAACGPQEEKPDDNTKQTEYDETAPLPRTTYKGKTYTVLYRAGQRYEEEWVSDESKRGDVINDAIASRNQAVVDRYGVNLDYESGKVSESNFENDFWTKVTLNTEDDYYQLIAGYTYRLAKVSVLGYCLNWLNSEQIPVVDTTADWWDGDFIQAAKYNGCTYIATGPLSLTDMYSSACMFFNKELLNQFKGPDATEELFELVKNGGWTLDKLMEYAKDCTSKVEGSEDDEGSVYGIVSTQSTMIDAYIYASDIVMTKRNVSTGKIELVKVDANNHILALSEKLKQFYNESGNAKLTSGQDPEHVQLLCEGKAVFASGTLSSAKDIQTYASELLYGVIPYPKYDENQKEYHTYKLDYKTGFCIPRSVKENNREFVGTITEALAYYSNKFVKPALYEKVLTHKLVQDKESSDSMDKILNGGLYEFANIYAYAWGDQQSPAHLLRNVVQKNLDFSGEYSANYRNGKGPYQTFLTALLNSFKSDDVAAVE